MLNQESNLEIQIKPLEYRNQRVVTFDLKDFIQDLKRILERNDKTLSAVKDLTQQGLTKITDVTEKVVDIRSRLPRRDFSSKTKRLYREVSLIRFNGRCQIHPGIRVVNHAGSLTDDGEYDHFFHHSENGIDQGWIISKKANREMIGNRQKYEPEFRIFQRELNAYLTENRLPRFLPAPRGPVKGDQMELFIR